MGRVVAVKALACKLAKAAYYLLRDDVNFSTNQTVWRRIWRQPQARMRVGWQPTTLIGSGRRHTFTGCARMSCFACIVEPTSVGRRPRAVAWRLSHRSECCYEMATTP